MSCFNELLPHQSEELLAEELLAEELPVRDEATRDCLTHKSYHGVRQWLSVPTGRHWLF
ncbi:MAG: hypothetical protein J2P31_18050 [Blastocatellia bacterium]|nr:hypothetical protein [Blastocatellia bacterium]